jgi:hypothetical protein
MKLGKINIFTALALFTVFAFTSCSKDDGAIPERIGIEEVPALTTILENGTGAATITLASQAAFEGKLKVAMFFAGAKQPDKIDVVVRKNGANDNVKVYKADVASLPANYTITAAEIVALFGGALTLNDTYDFAPDIYVGSKKYQSFPITGLGVGQGPSGMSTVGYFPWVRFSVK